LITVNGAEGDVFNFPDDTPEHVILSSMQKHYGSPKPQQPANTEGGFGTEGAFPDFSFPSPSKDTAQKIQDAGHLYKNGLTLNLADRGRAVVNSLTGPNNYDQELEIARARTDAANANLHGAGGVANALGMIAPAYLLGIGGITAIPQEGSLIRTALGTAADSVGYGALNRATGYHKTLLDKASAVVDPLSVVLDASIGGGLGALAKAKPAYDAYKAGINPDIIKGAPSDANKALVEALGSIKPSAARELGPYGMTIDLSPQTRGIGGAIARQDETLGENLANSLRNRGNAYNVNVGNETGVNNALSFQQAKDRLKSANEALSPAYEQAYARTPPIDVSNTAKVLQNIASENTGQLANPAKAGLEDLKQGVQEVQVAKRIDMPPPPKPEDFATIDQYKKARSAHFNERMRVNENGPDLTFETINQPRYTENAKILRQAKSNAQDTYNEASQTRPEKAANAQQVAKILNKAIDDQAPAVAAVKKVDAANRENMGRMREYGQDALKGGETPQWNVDVQNTIGKASHPARALSEMRGGALTNIKNEIGNSTDSLAQVLGQKVSTPEGAAKIDTLFGRGTSAKFKKYQDLDTKFSKSNSQISDNLERGLVERGQKLVTPDAKPSLIPTLVEMAMHPKHAALNLVHGRLSGAPQPMSQDAMSTLAEALTAKGQPMLDMINKTNQHQFLVNALGNRVTKPIASPMTINAVESTRERNKQKPLQQQR
jgi:hypothetical protein